MWQLNETGQVQYKNYEVGRKKKKTNYEVQLSMSKCIAKSTVFSLEELQRKSIGSDLAFFGPVNRKEGDHKLRGIEKKVYTHYSYPLKSVTICNYST